MKFLVPETIETERLFLRQFKETDWSDLHEYMSSEAATEFTMGRAFSEGETWRSMCGMLGHWQIKGYGPYAIESKVNGKVLGTVGFWYPNDWPGPEIKWALAPEHWGKAYASEAARAVQKIGLEYLKEIDLISFINAKNIPSIKLALAIGAQLDKEVEFRGDTWQIYKHPSQE